MSEEVKILRGIGMTDEKLKTIIKALETERDKAWLHADRMFVADLVILMKELKHYREADAIKDGPDDFEKLLKHHSENETDIDIPCIDGIMGPSE